MLFYNSFCIYAQSNDNDFSYRLQTYGFECESRSLQLLSANGEARPIDVYKGSRSTQIEYSGPPVFQVGSVINGAFQAEAKCELPRKSGNYLLIFFPKTSAGSGFFIFPMPNDTGSFPAGAIRMVNLSNKLLAVQLNREEVEQIKPYGMVTSKRVGNEQGQLRVRMAQQQEGEWLQVYSNFWEVRMDRRMLVFMLSKEDRIIIRKSSEYVIHQGGDD